MDAGKLDRRVTFRSKVTVQNTYGEQTVTWVERSTVWARKLSGKGREFYSGGITLSEGTVGIQVRRTPSLYDSALIARELFTVDVTNIKADTTLYKADKTQESMTTTANASLVTQLDVFVLEGVTYNIKSIDEVGRKDYLTIMGQAGVNDG